MKRSRSVRYVLPCILGVVLHSTRGTYQEDSYDFSMSNNSFGEESLSSGDSNDSMDIKMAIPEAPKAALKSPYDPQYQQAEPVKAPTPPPVGMVPPMMAAPLPAMPHLQAPMRPAFAVGGPPPLPSGPPTLTAYADNLNAPNAFNGGMPPVAAYPNAMPPVAAYPNAMPPVGAYPNAMPSGYPSVMGGSYAVPPNGMYPNLMHPGAQYPAPAQVTPPSLPTGHVSPLYPSKYSILGAPVDYNEESCVIYLDAELISRGEATELPYGGVQVHANPWDDVFVVNAFGKPSLHTRNILTLGKNAVLRVLRNVKRYELKQAIPDNCVTHPNDPNLLNAVDMDGRNVVGVLLRFTPEVFAVYEPQVVAPPSVEAPLTRSVMQQVGPCIFAGTFPHHFSQVKVTSSIRTLSVHLKTSPAQFSITYPPECSPIHFSRVAVWTLGTVDGTTVIAVTSPPPSTADTRWLLVPQVDFNSQRDHNLVFPK